MEPSPVSMLRVSQVYFKEVFSNITCSLNMHSAGLSTPTNYPSILSNHPFKCTEYFLHLLPFQYGFSQLCRLAPKAIALLALTLFLIMTSTKAIPWHYSFCLKCNKSQMSIAQQRTMSAPRLQAVSVSPN